MGLLQDKICLGDSKDVSEGTETLRLNTDKDEE